MEILNKSLCQICQKEQALTIFRNKWVCGRCLVKIESKINEEKDKYLDIIEEQIRNGN